MTLNAGNGIRTHAAKKATGFQGLRIIHSAYGMKDTRLTIIPAYRPGTDRQAYLVRYILKCLPEPLQTIFLRS